MSRLRSQAVAEGLGRRRDDAEDRAVGQREAIGRRGRLFVDRGDRAVVLLEALEHLAARDDRCRRPSRRAADVHVFDESNFRAERPAVLDERHQFIVVDAAHHDGVDLERLEACGGGRVDAVEHGVETVEACQVAEALAIERVEADGDAVQSGRAQRGRLRRQQDAVGREGEVADAGPRRERSDERRQIPPQQRLAAGQAHTIDAQIAEGVGDRANLLEREERVLRQPRIVGLGHAVEAPQVAAVGHRHAETAKRTPEAVEDRHRLPSLSLKVCYSRRLSDLSLQELGTCIESE